MVDLPLQDLPSEGEIVEVLFRLSKAAPGHLDLTVSTPRALRRLRFSGPRVVQFQAEMPDVLRGIAVQDIRDQRIGELSLWVSVGDGALTFWARGVSEITSAPVDHDEAAPSIYAGHAGRPGADAARLVQAEEVRAWGPLGMPEASFRYRTPRGGGALRHVSISTRPYARH